MQLSTSFLFLFPLLSSVLSSPSSPSKVQVTFELSSDSSSSSGQLDASSVGSLAYGFNGVGYYYIVSLVDDYAIVAKEYTALSPNVVLKKLNVADTTQVWYVAPTLYAGLYYIWQTNLGWLIATGSGNNTIRKYETPAGSLWRINPEPYAGKPGAPVRVESVGYCDLVLDKDNEFPIGDGAPVITYPANRPPSPNQGWKFLPWPVTALEEKKNSARFDEV
ncbi:MAG: hypothetical protein M1816_006820 [Peltula sp. TS41687]|nr:MAG: hypothetical protein M1816_006820 [Peltula sp. TS41687]